jgi:hypothetical protein
MSVSSVFSAVLPAYLIWKSLGRVGIEIPAGHSIDFTAQNRFVYFGGSVLDRIPTSLINRFSCRPTLGLLACIIADVIFRPLINGDLRHRSSPLIYFAFTGFFGGFAAGAGFTLPNNVSQERISWRAYDLAASATAARFAPRPI